MKLLWKAIADGLAADSTITTILGHVNPSAIRISYKEPEEVTVFPYCAFSEVSTVPAITGASPEILLTAVEFTFFHQSKIQVADLIKALYDLLKNDANTSPPNEHLLFWDLTNDDICTLWSEYRRSESVQKHDEHDVHYNVLEAEFRWRFN
jgi:hypothetical protein